MSRITQVSFTVLALAWMALPAPLASQGTDAAASAVAPITAPRGPIAAPVGIDRRQLTREAPASAPDVGASMVPPQEGTTVALMVVGAAALVAGLVIEGNAGTAIAIGGAVLGLVGLFMYLR